MSFERWLFGSLIYPAYHLVRRDGVLRLTSEYGDNQFLNTTQLRSLQQEKLRQLLIHVTGHVAHYRRALARRVSANFTFEDLRLLPPLTKAVIREQRDALVADNVPSRDLQPNSTSGSTGEPLRFFTDTRSLNCRKAAVVRNRRWAGIALGDREVRLWGSPIDGALSQELRGRLHGWLTRNRMISAYDLSRESLRRYVQQIADYRPQLLTSYPSVLEELAREARQPESPPIRPQAIIVSAETLYPHQRKMFEETFQARVFNRYGSREVGDIAQECRMHEGLHINADRVIVEIVRPDLTPCDTGETGDVLVTDLDNYGMPMIRYAIGDRAVAGASSACPCGVAFPRMTEIEGRSLDVVRFPNGSAVGGTYWTILLRARPGIDQFQVIQRSPLEVTIRYVARDSLSADFKDYVAGDVAARAGSRMRVIFEPVPNIPRNAAGKSRLVISELKHADGADSRETQPRVSGRP